MQTGEGGGKDQHRSQPWQDTQHRSPGAGSGGSRRPAGTRLVPYLVHVLGALACLQVYALGFPLGFPGVFWCDKEYA